jgi:spermidine/putrescine transport system substrate-binding protein
MHPHEHRLTRRNLVRGAVGAGAALGVAGVAAGCANTTEAVGSGDAAAGSAAVRKLVAPRPTGPDGLPLPRPDYSVTWAVTDDNPPIKDGLKPEGGTLNVFNYADYLWPGLVKRFEKQFNCSVKIATYNSADEATAKLTAGTVDFDVVIGLSANNMVTLIAQQLMAPLNHSYLPNLAKNIWPALQDPFYDRSARYTVPYVVWLDGIGWRNDKIDADISGMKVPWDIFWESKPWSGKVGILDDERDALSMPMQRDAMRAGRIPDLNTEDPAIIAKAGKDLSQLTGISNIKVDITDYQTLPEAKSWLHQAWSGDMLGAVLYYLPKGVKPDVISFWGPDTGGVVQNDLLWVVSKSKKQVLAHAFLNFLLDPKNAYDNFVQFNGYTPPQNTIDAESLVKKGLIPKSIAGAVLRPDQFANNQELLALSVDGAKFWQNAWAKFKAG